MVTNGMAFGAVRIAAWVFLGTVACQPAPPVSSPLGEREAADDDAAAATTVSRPEPEPEPSPTERTMQHHFATAVVMRDAVISGDLPRVVDTAATLHIEATASPAKPGKRHEALLDALNRAKGSTEIVAAADAVGQVAAACGGCHGSVGAVTDLSVPPTPAPGPSVQATMAVHRWAAAQMWEGVVLPSDDAWIRGITMFVEAPGCGGDAKRDDAARARCARVQTLVRRGHATEGLPARAGVYGALLTTCAGCHRAR